nr:uncharacterized protein LOC111986105 [Quercus suber]
MSGNGSCNRRVSEETSCMDFCNLLDLGFSGAKFIWTNRRDLYDLIQQKLDRVWVNLEWKLCFPKAFVSHLARINSDHCLFLLSMVPNLGQIGVRPFRFQPVWLSHDGFPNIVKEAWEGNPQNVCHAINMFANKAKIWTKEVFGNIFWKKMNLSARLVEVEKALVNAPSQRLINIHNFLLGELENILNLEEELWGMKSRTNWLIQGERNTNFFHIFTLIEEAITRSWASKTLIGIGLLT